MRSVGLLAGALAVLALVAAPPVLRAGEYDFDVAETEKKPYHLGGYLEIRPALSGVDRDAAFTRLRRSSRSEEGTLAEYDAALLLEGGLEWGPAQFQARTNTRYRDADPGSTFDTTLYEGSLTVRPSSSLALGAGKRPLAWGKGYAWNPVAFVDRPKDPEEPDLNREGRVLASAEYVKSFGGPLRTLAVTPVLLPVSERVNDDFGEPDRLNAAGKLYLLLYDTDVDLLFLAGGSRSPRYGLDFSRNVTTNLEVHGEYARIEDSRRSVVDGGGLPHPVVADVASWLVGVRYLTERDTTFIVECYRNGTGYTEQETREYFAFVHRAYDAYRSSGSDAQLLQAAEAAERGYGRPNAGRSYGYLRVSQKEPFGLPYWTPALSAIANLEDGSGTVSPELAYTGITNLELRLKGTVFAGDRLTEFGEKPSDYRVELLARYYF